MENTEPSTQATVEGQKERPVLTNDLRIALELLKVSVCPECDGSGAKQVQISAREYVTHEMAIDAGDRSMEGSLYSDDEWEVQQCRWCYERAQLLSEHGGEHLADRDNPKE